MSDDPTSTDQHQEAGADPPAHTAPGDDELNDVRTQLAAERDRSVGYLRRALLAEHAGSVVPELLAGDTPEALEASLETARSAFESARAAARAELERQQAAASQPAPALTVPVPTGTPARDAAEPGGLSPLQKIAAGLRR